MRTVLIGSLVVTGVSTALLIAGLDHPAARTVAALTVGAGGIIHGMTLDHLYPSTRKDHHRGQVEA